MATYRTNQAEREKLFMNGKCIGIFDTAKGNGLATFNVTHAPDKSAKACFVGSLEFAVGLE